MQTEQAIRVCDTNGQVTIEVPLKGPILQTMMSPDGTRLLVNFFNGDYEIWDLGKRERVSQGKTANPQFAHWNESSTHYLTCDARQNVQVRTRDGKAAGTLFRPRRGPNRFALNVLGDVMYLGSDDGTVTAYTARGDVLPGAFGHQANVRGLHIGPSNRLFSWSSDATVRVVDGQSMQLLAPVIHCRSSIVDVAASLDGRWFATLEKSGAWRLWDARSGNPLSPEYHGPDKNDKIVMDIRRGCVATMGYDGRFRMWSLHTDQVINPKVLQAKVTRRTGLLLDPRGMVRSASQSELKMAEEQSRL